ncbi:hypothetical protein AB0F88_40205 [Streptosporangium sp. NPDC023963]|uniref:hypothetical protein n=1 Tax=Streptosporangium sp. NPDC023963 TaxID=3155608 RepID=UPI00341D842E
MEFADIKGRIKLPEKTVSICLRGDLQAEFEGLERDLAAARSKPKAVTLSGGNEEAETIAQMIADLSEEMREHSTVFRFRGLTKRAYSDLVAQYPPTREQEEKGNDVNWETFPVALIAACAIEPKMTEAEAGELNDMVTQAQWNAIYMAASAVNAAKLDIPNSSAASAVLASSRRSSK